MIKVKISPEIRAYQKHGAEIEINWPGVTVKDLMDHLNVNPGEVGSILVNGVLKNLDYKLEDGSQVVFLPILCGG